LSAVTCHRIRFDTASKSGDKAPRSKDYTSIQLASTNNPVVDAGALLDSIRLDLVQEAERKTGDEPVANAVSDDWRSLRELFDALSCFFDRGQEIRTETSRLRFIVTRMRDHFRMRFGMKDHSHRLRPSRSEVRQAGDPLSKPQFFHTGFDLVIDSGNQTLGKLYTISQREFHRVSGELI
jgi:hypothetical protein